MKLYVFKINEQGSLVATDSAPQISRLGIKRTPGQRYQVPSILRAANETKDPEVVEAANVVMDGLHEAIEKDGYAIIEWAIKTDNPVMMPIDGDMVETKRKWADLDLAKLDDVLEAAMTPTTTGGNGGNSGNGAGTGRRHTANLNR